MSGYVLVCDQTPVNGVCSPEFERWVSVDSLFFESTKSIFPTFEEFNSSLPWIISILFMAWGFRLLVRQLLNR